MKLRILLFLLLSLISALTFADRNITTASYTVDKNFPYDIETAALIINGSRHLFFSEYKYIMFAPSIAIQNKLDIQPVIQLELTLKKKGSGREETILVSVMSMSPNSNNNDIVFCIGEIELFNGAYPIIYVKEKQSKQMSSRLTKFAGKI